ncbi:hypothetical protein GGH94_001516 [Coemansia aciculifera]|uniref:PAS domain-containing protein n=1 Tax=Coemansia aciculifera TaxID=417176 RepID=A0A9W8INP1_9FUNG|nr:hypothetical protein GGH94_001516 [Coemansia aciculifera]KAJ2876440.1 hypothetical protein GGH93_000757 [Coemansia aciculifera]
MPVSYVSIYERDAPEIVLYVSANCRAVLGYEPEEMVGNSILDYSCDSHAKHYSCQWPADNPELGVTMLPHNLRHKDGHKVFTHVTSINCSGHMFAIVTGFPELGEVQINESILYKLQYETEFDQGSATVVGNEEEAREATKEDLLNPAHQPITKDSLRKANMYTARACRAKACFVLCMQPSDSVASVQGPTIEFVTNSISSIFDGATDGYEIIGMPFFSLVAPADITKAAVYMDNLRTITRPQLCSLRLLRYPTGSSAVDDSESLVEVELFGAVSDNKTVLLCQKLRRRTKPSSGRRAQALEEEDTELPYMSLEEIISSDPESTDIGDLWNELVF